MRIARLFAAVLVSCALIAAAAPAFGYPPFPLSYRGTVSGTVRERDDAQGTTTKASWTIRDVTLRRGHPIKSDAGWSVNYAVTRGKITYHEVEAGLCSYAFDATLPLRTSLDKTSAPFALSQSLFFNHPTTALGLMVVKHGFTVTETCPQPDGGPAQISKRAIALPTLFDPGEKRVKLGHRFANHNSSRDSSGGRSSTIRWSWVLNPSR